MTSYSNTRLTLHEIGQALSDQHFHRTVLYFESQGINRVPTPMERIVYWIEWKNRDAKGQGNLFNQESS